MLRDGDHHGGDKAREALAAKRTAVYLTSLANVVADPADTGGGEHEKPRSAMIDPAGHLQSCHAVGCKVELCSPLPRKPAKVVGDPYLHAG